MKRVLVVVCLIMLALARTASAVSLPGCGSSVDTGNDSHPVGPFGWLQYNVSTTVELNLCTLSVHAEANVMNFPGSSIAKDGFLTANATRQIPTGGGTWTTSGRHSVVIFLLSIFNWGAFDAPNSSSTTTVNPWPPEPIVVDPEPTECDGEVDPETGHCAWVNCPIIISMDRHGYDLTNARNGVPFDLNANGDLERVAWTRADGEGAFLAYDRNGNGRIDDGTELFGNHTPVGHGGTAPNGFEALRFSLGLGILNDTLDARSPIWSKLLLWTDRNHNGLSEPDELTRLCESGVVSISLDYKTTKRTDKFGNEFRQRSEIGWADGSTSRVFDVWLTKVK